MMGRVNRIRAMILSKLPRLPRGARILRNLVILAGAAFVFYLFLGAPPHSDEELFRRKERQNLIGPSQVLAILNRDWQNGRYDRIVIAESEFGYVMMPVSIDRHAGEGLHYAQKLGGTTLMVVPGSNWWPSSELPWIIAFDGVPEAARAELTLTLYYEEHNAYIPDGYEDLPVVRYERDYSLSSEREYEGFFLFRFVAAGEGARTFVEEEAIRNLASLGELNASRLQLPATVRLYDASGTLLSEQATELSRTTTHQAALPNP